LKLIGDGNLIFTFTITRLRCVMVCSINFNHHNHINNTFGFAIMTSDGVVATPPAAHAAAASAA